MIGRLVRKIRRRERREKILRGRRKKIGKASGRVKSGEKVGMSLESMGQEGEVGRNKRDIRAGVGRMKEVGIGTAAEKGIEVGRGTAVGTGREGEVGAGKGNKISERIGMIVEVEAQA